MDTKAKLTEYANIIAIEGLESPRAARLRNEEQDEEIASLMRLTDFAFATFEEFQREQTSLN